MSDNIFNEIKLAFEQFKTEHSEQLEEIKSGFDDVVRAEKVDRINNAISEMQQEIDRLNSKVVASVMPATGRKREVDPEYTRAFNAFMRRGEEINPRAAHSGSVDADGGFLAPVEWDRTITDKLVEISPMRQIASTITIGGRGIKKIFNLRGTASGWVGETAARPATATATFGEFNYELGEVYANPSATQSLLDDAEVDLGQWLAGEVDTEFAVREGAAFVAGDGSNKPFGFLTFATGGANAGAHPIGSVEVKSAAAPAAITGDELLDLVHLLPASFTDGASFVMNRNTIAAVRKLKDVDGQYLWRPGLEAGNPQTLLGYPVVEMQDMPAIATGALPIAFGNFSRGYLIVDKSGTTLLRDPYTNKPFVQFYVTRRVGGGVLNPEAIKVLRMA